MTKITKRLLDKIGLPDLIENLSQLSQSDLNSLLLEIYRSQTDKLTPADLLKKYQVNRFVKPSELDPVAFFQLQADIAAKAQAAGIEPVILSPVAPLGSCSVMGPVDQNNVISAARSCEVLSDSTNMLAIYLADKIKRRELDNAAGIHACSLERLTRAQMFSGTRSFAHFGMFCLVSSGKDTGSYSCEMNLLTKQMSFYRMLFDSLSHRSIEIVLRQRSGYPDSDGFFVRMHQVVQALFSNLPVSIETEDKASPYYRGLNYKLYTSLDGERIEIGDGGFTDWTQLLLGNKKERCLISGISLERLLALS